MATRPGPLLAASDSLGHPHRGRGAATPRYPHLGVDPFVIGAQIVLALQTIVSRNVDPIESAVVSVGIMQGGTTYNVIPDALHIGGTVRSFRPEVRDLVERRIGRDRRGIAAAHGATAALDYRRRYPPTVNHADEAAFASDVAAEICGADKVVAQLPARHGRARISPTC